MDKPTKRKYNLHYKIRKQGYKLKTKQRTILANNGQEVLSKQAKNLVDEYGYEVQLTLF